ncbi:MAG: SGNH/GDSL hydrolase family protein [Bacteroidales bacterium]|nr:SGNH/GDSL hydrolase family protein [Bacteroidales bacterium]
MKIQIFSDSLALPREIPQKVFYEETYPAKLSENHILVQYSKGAGTINDLLDQTFYYKMFCPDVVIIQCGIVDCAPRPFTQFEEHFFKLNFFTKACKAILKRLTKNWLRNVRKVAWTSPDNFRLCCKQFVETYPDIPIFAIGILPPRPEYENLAKGISKRILLYNSILEEVFGDCFINTSNIPDEGIMSDHHHLTAIGHQFIYDKIIMQLSRISTNIK